MLQDKFDHSDDLSTTGIATLEDLRRHLQWAIEVEHSTLPPYLTALYSLDPMRNADAAQLIGGVFVEEMIHLALAANLLNAVGGQPRLDAPHMLPPHPRTMPHADRSIALALLPFGQEALGMFLRLEQPAHPGDPAEGDNYETIGQFYDAIEKGLRRLCAEVGEDQVFTGDPARQVAGGPFAHTAGHLSPVTDLDSALAALGRSSSRARARPAPTSGTRTSTCSTPRPRRSPTTTGSRNSRWGGATSLGTRLSPAPPARR